LQEKSLKKIEKHSNIKKEMYLEISWRNSREEIFVGIAPFKEAQNNISKRILKNYSLSFFGEEVFFHFTRNLFQLYVGG